VLASSGLGDVAWSPWTNPGAGLYKSPVDAWNRFMDATGYAAAKMPFVENHPENPHINYLRNPISGVCEIERFMSRLDAIIVAVLLAAFLLFVEARIPAGPYSYDESDYMYAASLGVWANYVDTPSRSVAEFVSMGLRYGTEEELRVELSTHARSIDDVNFYRHWHGPLYTYFLTLASPWKHNEQAMRALTLLFPVTTFFLINVMRARATSPLPLKTMISSPSLIKASPKEKATRLMLSVVPLVKTISSL